MKRLPIENLIRPHIKKLKPYSSARDEFKGEANIFLDANENSFGSPLTDRFCDNLNRYPDPYCTKLREKLAKIKSVSANSIFVGNGSDEAIDLLIKLFCNPAEDNVLITPPTYGMYEVSANINNVATLKSNLTSDYNLDVDNIFETINANTKIIFLCSPNNPTGNLLSKDSIFAILRKFEGMVVVDEAYIEYSKTDGFISELKNFENLCITQTFSKAWGLAGLRVGTLYASSEIISYINKIKPPYNVNSISQEIALRALNEKDFSNYIIEKTLAEKQKLISELSGVPEVVRISQSDSNFILTKFKSSKNIFEKLLDNGIVARDRSSLNACEDCIRITVGTPQENQTLIEELKGEQINSEIYNNNLWKTVRKTNETKISVTLSKSKPTGGYINTGLGFFDHMLELFAFHSGLYVAISANGDLETDPHHTIEDIGITLGETLHKMVSSLKGYKRYGFCLPMDEAKAEVLLDLSGRTAFVWNVNFEAPLLGVVPTSMFSHFFSSLGERLKCSLHITASGKDDHHIIEAVFKGFGRALRQALEETNQLQSTKGWL